MNYPELQPIYPVYDDEIFEPERKDIPTQLFDLLNQPKNATKFKLWQSYNNNGTWNIYLYSATVHPEIPKELYSRCTQSNNADLDKTYLQIIQLINQINNGTI